MQVYQSALASANGGITPQLESAIESMNTHNAWQVDSEVHRILLAVGLKDPNVKVNIAGFTVQYHHPVNQERIPVKQKNRCNTTC